VVPDILINLSSAITTVTCALSVILPIRFLSAKISHLMY
jgi:hypothetical protein